ncbi:cupredoxin domain-containing protein [Xylocopilactobacillus apicola]|uniref:Copper-binding protein n=1 Tax=Xylocopilactobacillus apicola TaxID=2932184 RepID=A0AAU9DB12_9LACO|nr:cupredoxin domain-containing protein [Xylocopilactobacillus apicola]BDR57977.1 copper-binding protein [Xylocopilactobacillus apicola]
MIKVAVLIISLLLIGFIGWWFFAPRKEIAVNAKETKDHLQNVEVVVDGGYKPSTVVVKQGEPAEITFNRKDPSSCLDQVVFPDWGINEFLPENEVHEVKIDTSKPGVYQYTCGMDMFHGKVVVE